MIDRNEEVQIDSSYRLRGSAEVIFCSGPRYEHEVRKALFFTNGGDFHGASRMLFMEVYILRFKESAVQSV